MIWKPKFDMENPTRHRLQKMTLAAVFAGLAVLLSPISFPVGPSRCFPFQHTVNALSGVVLGPFWACGAAFVSSLIRNIMGTGTILAFPGSLFGALAVGFIAGLLPGRFRFLAAFSEPAATATIGAWVAALIASSPEGRMAMFGTLSIAFFLSSAPGSLIGCVLLRLLNSETRNKQEKENTY